MCWVEVSECAPVWKLRFFGKWCLAAGPCDTDPADGARRAQNTE